MFVMISSFADLPIQAMVAAIGVGVKNNLQHMQQLF
jgi:hypothetical protein